MTNRVGVPVSLSGQFSLQGSQTLAGIRAWCDDVNDSGGLAVGGGRHPVELVWRDDGSRRDRVRAITESLIVDDRVDLLIGPYSAVLANAAAEVARSHGKLMWNQGGASPLVYQRGNPWVVGILTSADEYLAGLLPAVREVWPSASIVGVVRASAGAFPRDVASGVERSANELGFQLVLSELFDPDGGDLAGTVKAILRAAPDVLAVVGRYQNDLAIAELLANAAPNVGAVAVVAAGVDGFRERLGDLAEGFVGPSQWEAVARHRVDFGPSVDEVRASLIRAGHSVVDYPMAQAYAVGVVIQRCIQECGSVDDAALREAAALLDFTTFYGRFRIHPETGRQTGKLGLMVQWQQGKKVIVWPPECRERELAYPWR